MPALTAPSLCSKLYNQGPNETTVFLGPWEVVNTEPRRVVWQCSYAGEVLEHFCKSLFPAGEIGEARRRFLPTGQAASVPTSLAPVLNPRS